ncbi:MAG TPA: hypothetical protein VL460_00325 [Caulobacteraceae bacterium]|nr:hypothetical protein [Caulobacteraceae bacterium]
MASLCGVGRPLVLCAMFAIASAGPAPAAEGATLPPAPSADIYYADPSSPDISGFWRPASGVAREQYSFLDGIPLRREGGLQNDWPYTPAWRAADEARRKASDEGRPFGDPLASCWPPGLVRAYVAANTPFEITQTPGRVQLVHEKFGSVRRIYTDGRGHPKLDPSGFTLDGHSIGRWEGATLIVDTVGIRRETTLSNVGLLHSERLHVVERFTRVDPQTLTIEVVLEDPKAMTRPVRMSLTYTLSPGGEMIEDICPENNRDTPDANLVIQTELGARKRYGFDLPE